MGKGDKKSKRGKIVIGSYGVRRPRKKKNTMAVAPEVPPQPSQEVEITTPQAKPKKPAKAKKE